MIWLLTNTDRKGDGAPAPVQQHGPPLLLRQRGPGYHGRKPGLSIPASLNSFFFLEKLRHELVFPLITQGCYRYLF